MRYQHVRFHKIEVGEDFFSDKFRYTKTSYFVGTTVLDGDIAVVMPWTKVRSTRPYGKKKLIRGEPILGDVSKTIAVNAPYAALVRPSVTVTPGGDRRSETIGGNELTPSA